MIPLGFQHKLRTTENNKNRTDDANDRTKHAIK